MPDSTPSKETPDLAELSRVMGRVAEQSQSIVRDFMERGIPDGEELKQNSQQMAELSAAFYEMTARMMSDPARLMRAQAQLWQDYMTLWQTTTQRMLGSEPAAPVIETGRDRRFKHAAWEDSTVFNYIKQSYLLTSRWLMEQVEDVEGMDDATRRKVDFYTRQFIDALAPSNFVMTNPEVLEATIASGGDNLVNGLENMLEDLKRGRGELLISMTDADAFELGRNIAASPGKVVYQNDLAQLIQYSPSTETVHRRPLLIVPPWINKFYVLDLQEKNSFIKWAVDQGHTVFVVSWVNPTEKHRDMGFEEYIKLGLIAMLDAVEKQTGEDEINVIGYCLGGTMLAAALTILKAKGDQRIRCATFFTAMTDFTDAGEVQVFIDDAQIKALEEKMKRQGYLDAKSMQTSFNLLRSNDLIWSFVVNNYLMGKDPLPFDLLYWNSDSTNLPAMMHSFYLRNMYHENNLAKPGGITLMGVPVDLREIDLPTCWVAAKEDHIAPWDTVYRGAGLLKKGVKFILGASGHIAGIINPPAAHKYCYWTNSARPKEPQAWLDKATRHDGSWWPEWDKWIAKHGGGQVPARDPAKGKLKPIENAPGSYVKERAESLGG